MKLKPLGDRLIVRAIEEEETTASGIVLPDTAKEKPQKGKVIAVGEGRFDDEGEKRIPLDVSEGDEVLYSKYGGTEIKVDGEDVSCSASPTSWPRSSDGGTLRRRKNRNGSQGAKVRRRGARSASGRR